MTYLSLTDTYQIWFN